MTTNNTVQHPIPPRRISSSFGHCAAALPLFGFVGVYQFLKHGYLPYVNPDLSVGSPLWWQHTVGRWMAWDSLGLFPGGICMLCGMFIVHQGVVMNSKKMIAEGSWTATWGVLLFLWYMIATF